MSEKSTGIITGNKKTSMGLDENIAGALCYFLGFITGIVFLLTEKDNKFIKFHAIQSIAISIPLMVLNMIISALYAFFPWSMFWLIGILSLLISLAGLILWIVLMMKAFQGEIFKLPIVGDIAEKQAQL